MDISLENDTRKAFLEGFICNVTNPKVTLLMLSVFTQVIRPDTPLPEQVFFGSIFVLVTIVYWSALVLLLQRELVRRWVSTAQRKVDRIFGGILIALGLKIALVD